MNTFRVKVAWQVLHDSVGIIEPMLDMRQEALAGRRQVVERAAFAEVERED
jgi:hypothetical protein